MRPASPSTSEGFHEAYSEHARYPINPPVIQSIFKISQPSKLGCILSSRGFICAQLNFHNYAGEKSSVKIVSLVGHPRRAPKVFYRAVELQITSLNHLWQEVQHFLWSALHQKDLLASCSQCLHVDGSLILHSNLEFSEKLCICFDVTYCLQLIKNSKFVDCQQLASSQFDLWYRGPKPHALDRDKTLEQAGIPQDANMEISLTVYGMQPLVSSAVNAVPETLSSTPINVAFSASPCSFSIFSALSFSM